MNSYQCNDILEENNEDGIWCDYQEGTWIFFIKDEIWTHEELQLFKRNKLNLSYFQKGIVDAFLIEVNDVIEMSDVPFCMLDASEELIAFLKSNDNFKALFLLVDNKNKIIARKEGKCSNEVSKIIKENCLIQLTKDYNDEAFEKALIKLQSQYEPFECEPFILTTQSF